MAYCMVWKLFTFSQEQSTITLCQEQTIASFIFKKKQYPPNNPKKSVLINLKLFILGFFRLARKVWKCDSQHSLKSSLNWNWQIHQPPTLCTVVIYFIFSSSQCLTHLVSHLTLWDPMIAFLQFHWVWRYSPQIPFSITIPLSFHNTRHLFNLHKCGFVEWRVKVSSGICLTGGIKRNKSPWHVYTFNPIQICYNTEA